MAHELVERFYTISDYLALAISSGNDNATAEFDREIEKIWQKLLDLQPSNNQEAYSLIEFFLGHIQGGHSGGLIDQQSKERVLQLAKIMMA